MSLSPVRRSLKALALRLPIVTGWSAARRRRVNRATIFCFHDVSADVRSAARGERSLHVPAGEFAEYARWIAAAYSVIPLRELVARHASGRALHGTACLTFDDAYEGVLEHALPVTRALGVPVTIFAVAQASRDRTGFWWDALADAGALTAAERERCLTGRRGDGALVHAEHPRLGDPRTWTPRAAGWDALRAVAGDAVSIEAHTLHHCNLASLEPFALQAELARAPFEAELGVAPALVSYPYGLVNDLVVRAAAHEGYVAGVTMAFGQAGRGDHALALPRVNVPAGISMDALECRAAGLHLRAG